MTTRPDPSRATAPPPPPEAAAVFGAQLSNAEAYVALLCGPGVEQGLIGPREPERVWDRHVINSAALSSLIPARAHVVDVGAGAGLPGIPLALARPDLTVTLAEPMERRVRFLRDVVARLGLEADIRHARAEDLPRDHWDVAVVRAVAPLARLIPLTLPLLHPGGALLALKGSSVHTEIAKAESQLSSWKAGAEVLTVTAGAGEATIVRIERPRRARDER